MPPKHASVPTLNGLTRTVTASRTVPVKIVFRQIFCLGLVLHLDVPTEFYVAVFPCRGLSRSRDALELGLASGDAPPVDTDKDGVPDALDSDSDNRCVINSFQKVASSFSPLVLLPRCLFRLKFVDFVLCLCTQADGKTDKEEFGKDSDKDGIPDARDSDAPPNVDAIVSIQHGLLYTVCRSNFGTKRVPCFFDMTWFCDLARSHQVLSARLITSAKRHRSQK
jgi:hypothetical protein